MRIEWTSCVHCHVLYYGKIVKESSYEKFFSVGKLIVYRTESTWAGWDTEEITLYRDNKGEFFLKGRPSRKQQFPDFKPNTNTIKRVSVPEKWVKEIFDRLAPSRILAYPMLDMGEDSGFTELEIGGYCGKSHYRWWSSTPETWEVLEEIGEEIFNQFYNFPPKGRVIPCQSSELSRSLK